jgi:hypothetical protein
LDDDDYSDSGASYMNIVEVSFGRESVSDNSSANMSPSDNVPNNNVPALPPLESESVNVPNNTVELPSAQSSPPAPTMDAKAAPLLSRSQMSQRNQQVHLPGRVFTSADKKSYITIIEMVVGVEA